MIKVVEGAILNEVEAKVFDLCSQNALQIEFCIEDIARKRRKIVEDLQDEISKETDEDRKERLESVIRYERKSLLDMLELAETMRRYAHFEDIPENLREQLKEKM